MPAAEGRGHDGSGPRVHANACAHVLHMRASRPGMAQRPFGQPHAKAAMAHSHSPLCPRLQAAKRLGFPSGSYSVMHLDLSSLESVRQFAANFKASGRRLDSLVCNAAVYLPTAKEPT